MSTPAAPEDAAESSVASLSYKAALLDAMDAGALGAVHILASLGAVVLGKLGFDVLGAADVKIDIGDENEDEARISLTWKLPPEAPETATTGDA